MYESARVSGKVKERNAVSTLSPRLIFSQLVLPQECSEAIVQVYRLSVTGLQTLHTVMVLSLHKGGGGEVGEEMDQKHQIVLPTKLIIHS